ncbi:hypothetical protein RB653_006760 [Dictyostelium firmibasis]|uniref:Uncharacterized protein n=1 Tax=Dictyostelium firmibasis TaxID=79012 RepID=A0AAN7TKQ9_9MYCE
MESVYSVFTLKVVNKVFFYYHIKLLCPRVFFYISWIWSFSTLSEKKNIQI